MKQLILLLLLSFSQTTLFAQKHITLIYNGKNQDVIKAVDKANEILNNGQFYEEIKKHIKFDHSDLSVREIAGRIEKANQKIVIVRKFKPIANAGTTSSNKIKISKSLFGKDTGNFVLSIAVNTLIHEVVHAVDFLNTGDEFTHDGNKAEGQENTAPWVIGAIAEKMVEEQLKKTQTINQ